jgi:hypothetical protein
VENAAQASRRNESGRYTDVRTVGQEGPVLKEDDRRLDALAATVPKEQPEHLLRAPKSARKGHYEADAKGRYFGQDRRATGKVRTRAML